MTPEVRNLSPGIDKFLFEHWFTVNGIEKTKMKKQAGKLFILLKHLRQQENCFFVPHRIGA